MQVNSSISLRGPSPLIVGAVLFEKFELLDIFGPLEMLGALQERVEIVMLGETQGPVHSNQGPCGYIDRTFTEIDRVDLLLVPGGMGTRPLVNQPAFLDALQRLATQATHVASICTGAGLLAKAGLLDGLEATTNKISFAWVESQGPNITWIKEARWVEAGKFWTSSGVSAGMDMTLGLIATLFDRETSVEVARYTEYEWHEDKTWDPFARLAGLVD